MSKDPGCIGGVPLNFGQEPRHLRHEPIHGENHWMSPIDKSPISTPDAPAAIGPYTQAIHVGNMIYTSGQISLDPATGQLVEGGIREQTTRVLENLKAILTAAQSGLQNVVKTTVFLKNMGDFAVMNEVYASYLAKDGWVAPARSTLEVARLPKEVLVEIEVIALR
jgi:2-iminobutanoate/2-iminopropanoate deaminase